MGVAGEAIAGITGLDEADAFGTGGRTGPPVLVADDGVHVERGMREGGLLADGAERGDAHGHLQVDVVVDRIDSVDHRGLGGRVRARVHELRRVGDGHVVEQREPTIGRIGRRGDEAADAQECRANQQSLHPFTSSLSHTLNLNWFKYNKELPYELLYPTQKICQVFGEILPSIFAMNWHFQNIISSNDSPTKTLANTPTAYTESPLGSVTGYSSTRLLTGTTLR